MKKLLMKTVFKISVLVLVLTFWGQRGLSQSTDSVALALREINSSVTYEMSCSIGFTGKASPQMARLDQLVRLAPDSLLLEQLRSSTRPVTRLYAYKALLRKSVPIPAELMKKLKADKTVVRTIQGCVISSASVSSLLNVPICGDIVPNPAKPGSGS